MTTARGAAGAPTAFLLDLDGTLYTETGPVTGAVEALATLKQRRVPFRCITNTTRRPRAAIVDRLRNYGFGIQSEDVFTAVLASAEIMRGRGFHTVAPFVAEATLPDLGEFDLVGGTARRVAGTVRPDAVLVGDLGDRWTYALLNEAFRYLMAGADLIALSRDRYWMRGDGLALDAGPFVVGLEHASGAEATVAGKPSAAFFAAAARSLGLAEALESSMVVIGDDLWSDVEGAQRAGFRGWLVRTGKFRQEVLESSGIRPDRILGSVAEVVAPA